MDDMMQGTPLPNSAPYGAPVGDAPETTVSKRDAVAGAIDSAASRLHDKADGMQGGRLAGLTDRTANALDATGRYIRDLDARDVLDDLGQVAKRHPGKSLIAAAALGFLVGRALTRPAA